MIKCVLKFAICFKHVKCIHMYFIKHDSQNLHFEVQTKDFNATPFSMARTHILDYMCFEIFAKNKTCVYTAISKHVFYRIHFFKHGFQIEMKLMFYEKCESCNNMYVISSHSTTLFALDHHAFVTTIRSSIRTVTKHLHVNPLFCMIIYTAQ